MIEPHQDPLTRRRFLTRGSAGIGAAALASLLRDGSADELLPHFAPKAKRVIYLHMSGGPSQIETFDPKPQLEKWHRQRDPANGAR
jgi:hypothetical protein